MKLWAVDSDGKLTLSLHAFQQTVWNSERRFNYILGDDQSGKTSFLPWYVAREVANKISVPRRPFDMLAVAASYDHLSLRLLPEMLKAFEEVLKIGRYWPDIRVIEICDHERRFVQSSRQESLMKGRIYLTHAGSLQCVEALDSMRHKVFEVAVFDDAHAAKYGAEMWEVIKRKLSGGYGRRALLTASLRKPEWVYDEIKKQQGQTDDLYIEWFSPGCNPATRIPTGGQS